MLNFLIITLHAYGGFTPEKIFWLSWGLENISVDSLGNKHVQYHIL